jgi:hypothetical protein
MAPGVGIPVPVRTIVSDEALTAGVEVVGRWSHERFGRLGVPLTERSGVRWHTYRLGRWPSRYAHLR